MSLWWGFWIGLCFCGLSTIVKVFHFVGELQEIKLNKYKPPSKNTYEIEASLPKVGCIVQ